VGTHGALRAAISNAATARSPIHTPLPNYWADQAEHIYRVRVQADAAAIQTHIYGCRVHDSGACSVSQHHLYGYWTRYFHRMGGMRGTAQRMYAISPSSNSSIAADNISPRVSHAGCGTVHVPRVEEYTVTQVRSRLCNIHNWGCCGLYTGQLCITIRMPAVYIPL
jgi:hypothetical protein